MRTEVVVGIVLYKSKVLIVKRKEGEGNLRWQFPGGEVEDNETDEQATTREIFEETGCKVRVIKKLGQRIHPYTNKLMSYWACEYIDGTITIADDDLEDVQWVDRDKLLDYFTTSVYQPVIDFLKLN